MIAIIPSIVVISEDENVGIATLASNPVCAFITTSLGCN